MNLEGRRSWAHPAVDAGSSWDWEREISAAIAMVARDPRYRVVLCGRALRAGLLSAQGAEVRQVIEAYRDALEHKDLDRLVGLYLSFSARQREALRAYLDNATGLTVEMSDITVEPRGGHRQ